MSDILYFFFLYLRPMLRTCLSKVKLRFHVQILDVCQYASLLHSVIIRKVIAGLLS